MKKNTKKFTQKSTLADILKAKRAEEVLAKHGVPCVSCPMAKFEIDKLQIGQVCKMYKLDFKAISKDLNKLSK